MLVSRSKVADPENRKPVLFITLKDDSAKSVSAATVKLHKNNIDSSLIKISDSNRVSQTSLNLNLIPNVVFYGHSIMAQTGVLKIINNAAEDYKVTDSLITVTIKKDSSFMAYRRAHHYLIHSEKLSTPGTGKDTLINIRCGDTIVIRLPY